MENTMLFTLLFLALAFITEVSAHGAVTIPKPRNSIDGGVHPWNGTVPGVKDMPFMFWCAHPDADATDPRNITGSNGQACFFFNNGLENARSGPSFVSRCTLEPPNVHLFVRFRPGLTAPRSHWNTGVVL